MPYDGPGELAAALDDFDERIIMDPLAYSEIRTRPSLEERLESIISGAALMVTHFELGHGKNVVMFVCYAGGLVLHSG